MKGDKRGVALMLAIKPAPDMSYEYDDIDDMDHDECYQLLMESIAKYMAQIDEHPSEHNLNVLGMVEELLAALKVHIEEASMPDAVIDMDVME